MTTSIQKWGDSQGIRIPKFILEAVKWNENEKLCINAEEDRIVITIEKLPEELLARVIDIVFSEIERV